MMDVVAWLILRVVYAWMFLYPLFTLLRDFDATTQVVKLIVPCYSRFFAVIMVIVMVYGGLSILFGFYAQIAGFLLLIYSLMGVVVHYRLAALAVSNKLSEAASLEDKNILLNVVGLADVGNKTSAQKNIVLAAVACFFMLMGSGPMSLTMNLF